MSQWKWVNRQVLLLLHDESLAEHGGASGLRDAGLLDSALARPVNLALYEQPDIASLAASYGVGLAKNHPFVDGNKRSAFVAAELFLVLNGWQLNASDEACVMVMLSLAGGEIDEPSLATWLRGHAGRR